VLPACSNEYAEGRIKARKYGMKVNVDEQGDLPIPALTVPAECLQPRHQLDLVSRVWQLELLAHLGQHTVRLSIPKKHRVSC
jgi:hypothetical protein